MSTAIVETPHRAVQEAITTTTAVRAHIDEAMRRARLGMVEAADGRAAACLVAAADYAIRNIDNPDPRMAEVSGKLAIKVAELAELLTRDQATHAGPGAGAGDTYNVVQIDATRAEALERLRRLTGGAP